MSPRRRRRGAPIGRLFLLALVGLGLGAGAAYVFDLPARLGISDLVAEQLDSAIVARPTPTAAVPGRGGAERLVPATNAAPPGCCTLERIEQERGAEGCTWQVARWREAEPTKVPWGCPPGVTPTRGHPEVQLEASYTEKGSEGCQWYAARWNDGIVTRAPGSCPPGATVIRQALPHPRCYEPRRDVLPANVRPAGAGSMFQNCQVVTYYGYPGVTSMGILGEAPFVEILPRFRQRIASYDAANGPREAVGAIHVVAAVAQAYQTPDGLHLARIPPELMQRLLDHAERQDLLVFVDLQMGWSTVPAEMERVLPWLRSPRVHLALDPEFTMPRGVVPGRQIGFMTAEQINYAQEVLQQMVEADGLPNKILMVHQFIPEMIRNKQDIKQFPNVDLVIDMDGFGAAAAKISKYDVFVRDEKAEFGGIKLFYRQDTGLMTPEQVMRLNPQPDVIVYQ